MKLVPEWGGARTTGLAASLGLLILRVGTGGMMVYGHGWGKLMNFGQLTTSFGDPIGLGPAVTATLAVFAEVICSAAVVLGLATRLAAMWPAAVMAVAAFIVHADDPWGKKEFALLYLVPFVALMLTGPGRFSLDALIGRSRKG